MNEQHSFDAAPASAPAQPAPATKTPCEDPGYAAVRKFMIYTLSLPERTLRSGAGLVGGALRESTALLVPHAFQNSTTYSVMVRQMLDFLVEDVGGVPKPATAGQDATAKVENYVARKTVGNFVEMAGMATFHLSPLTLLAIVSDVAYGSQAYLKELSAELKKQGVIDRESTIDHVDDLLAAVAKASQTTAAAFDTPPLSVEGLKETIDQTRQAIAAIDPARVIPQAELDRMWQEMHTLADREGVGILEVSSTVTLATLEKVGYVGRGALSSVKVAGVLFDRHVIDHYRTSLAQIQEHGLYATLRAASGPYIEAVWENFSAERPTVTEEVVSGRVIGQAWSAVRRWLGGSCQTARRTDDGSAVDSPPAPELP
jgi:hypothetical protein